MARYRVGLRTRERILTATRDLLAEAGFEATTIKMICERAGVRAGSFYNLFGSKDEAVLSVVKEAINAVDPHPAGEGVDTTEELVDAYVRFVREAPGLARIYLQVAAGGGLTDNALAGRMLRHHERRVERFAEALRGEHPGLLDEEATAGAETMLATLNGLAFRWLLDGSFDFEGHVRRLASETVG